MAISDLSLTLYSNPGCPYVHRAVTTLHELSIPYKSVFIDLDTPRSPEYLAVNPRGTVPALTFTSPSFNSGKETIINESLVIIYFLADLFPNHLLPTAGTGVTAAAERARIFFFIDTWGNKIGSLLPKVLLASAVGGDGVTEAVDAVIEAVKKEIEPLLEKVEGDGDGPFLGGKDKFTLAEIVVAPFILRNFAWAEGGLSPISFKEQLLALPNFGKWATEILKNENLLKDWDVATFLEKSKDRLQKYKDGTFKPKV